MKTRVREKLEAADLHPLFVDIFCGDFARPHEVAVAEWREAGEPIFAPGHEPVSKEGRALLRHLSMTKGVNYDEQIRAFRDSLTPAVVVPDGWEKKGTQYVQRYANILIEPAGTFRAIVGGGDGWRSETYVDTLPEAFTAAQKMLERLGLVAPKTEPEDPNPWRTTDGMAPPKEAGGLVIETVDGDGDKYKYSSGSAFHCWGSQTASFRPVKWRYADGGVRPCFTTSA